MLVCVRISAVDALRAGRDAQGRQVIEIDPASLEPELREELIRISNPNWCGDCPAQFHLRYNDPREFGLGDCSSSDPIYPVLVEPTPEALVALVRDVRTERLRREAAKQAKHDEIVSLILALSPEDLVREGYYWHHGVRLPTWDVPTVLWLDLPSGDRRVDIPNDPRLAELKRKARVLCAERNTEAKKREQEIDEMENAAEAAEKAKKIAALEARNAWIREHGSPRLRRCLEEGITCGGLYRDERLALERPGWRWETDADPEPQEPVNPPEEAFAALDAARASGVQEAELVYWAPTVGATCDEGDEDFGEPLDVPGRYAVRAEFLGRSIVWQEVVDIE